MKIRIKEFKKISMQIEKINQRIQRERFEYLMRCTLERNQKTGSTGAGCRFWYWPSEDKRWCTVGFGVEDGDHKFHTCKKRRKGRRMRVGTGEGGGQGEAALGMGVWEAVRSVREENSVGFRQSQQLLFCFLNPN